MKGKLISIDSIQKWPTLIGRNCQLVRFEIGKPALLSFSDGRLRTTILNNVVETDHEIHLYTKNSIYKIEKL